ncbi:MAG: ABC transporter permease, partial [Promethearchaeota archaeon]
IMTVELSIIISSRVNDVRTAQQLSVLAIIPFLAIYILTETKIFTLDTNILLIIAGIVAVIDVCLFFASRVIFQREEILTKWK